MNATARNGDIWTGEPPEEGWWPYLDAAGNRYESREVPAYRIVMDRATVRTVNGRRGICPIETGAKASCQAPIQNPTFPALL